MKIRENHGFLYCYAMVLDQKMSPNLTKVTKNDFSSDFFSPRRIHRLDSASRHNAREPISYMLAFDFPRFSISKTKFC